MSIPDGDAARDAGHGPRDGDAQPLPARQGWSGPGGPRELPGAGGVPPRLALLADLAPALSWTVLSFAVICWGCGFFFDLEAGTWLVVAVWLVSGLIALLRPVEDFLAVAVFRLRRPTLAEEDRLRPVWHAVARRAGVTDKPFALWIQESGEISAVPTVGHTVAVTHWSLYTLPPQHLEAVLAHELAHHLGGRSWLTILGFWYSLPARAILTAVRLLGKLIRAVPAIGCLLAGFVFIAYLGVLVSMVMFNESLLQPLLYLLVLLAIPVMAWIGRWSERAADRVAAEMGYGPKLIEVLYGWQVRERPGGDRKNTLRNDLMSGQPKTAERIRALEAIVTPR